MSEGWRKEGEVVTMAQGSPLSNSEITTLMGKHHFKKSNPARYINSIAENPGYVFQEFMATEENIRRANFNIPKKHRQYYIARESMSGPMIRAWGFYE